MPDEITFDDAFGGSKAPADEITFDDAFAASQSLTHPAAGQFTKPGEMRIPGKGLPGSPDYVPASIGPAPKQADSANFGAALKSDLVEDEGTKKRLIAESLFPGDPKGADRVGIVDGKPVFVNDKGELQYVSTFGSRAAASTIANAPEAIAGTVGSFAASPVAGATMGAAGARGVKRAAAGLVFDEPQTIGGNLADVATEGAVTAGAGLLGKGLVALGNRSKIVDFTPADIGSAEKAREYVSKTLGIDLDLAQASGNRKLLALRDYASRYPGKTAEMIQAADDITAGKLDVATNKVLDLVAKAEPSAIAGRRGTNAAKAAITTARQAVYDAVDPLYKAAYKAVPEVADKKILGFLDLPYFKKAFADGQVIATLEDEAAAKTTETVKTTARVKVRDGLYKTVTTESKKDITKPDLRSLDYTKRALDDEIEGLIEAGSREKARALKMKRDEFVAALDALPNQQWQLARSRYGELIRDTVDPMEKGAVGIIAGISDQKAATAAAKIFSDPNVSTNDIAFAKARISQQDPEAWNGLVRQWLGQKWNAALKETQAGDVINPAGKFRQAVFGTPSDKVKLRNMLPDGAADDMDALMFAMEKLAKTPLGASRVSGSNTYRDTQIGEMLSGRLSFLMQALRPREAVLNAAEERAQEQGILSITEALLDPAKRRQLKQIVKMPPSRAQALRITTLLGGQVSAIAAADELSTDQMPLSQGTR